MSNSKQFTVSIYGRGRLLGLVVSEGMRCYPKSTWYDYSDAMKRGVALENQIASSGRMERSGVASVRRAVANQRSPMATDVTIKFSRTQGVDRAQVTIGRQSRSFVHRDTPTARRDSLEKTVAQIVQAIGRAGNTNRSRHTTRVHAR